VKWNICHNFPIQVVFFDDEAVVFHHGSGETHRLDKNASLILSTIQDSDVPNSESVLLSTVCDTELGDFDQQSLASILGALQNLQIIENI